MKTSKEWYKQHLPKEIADKAVANSTQQGNISNEAENLYEAISLGFNWGATMEGISYWNAIYHRAKDGEFDKLIITTPSIQDTINILMEYAATKGCKAVVTFEPLNSTNDKV
jgi:hypothetical protein